MFNMDDFNNLNESMDSIPDGLIDASDYANDMELITNILDNIEYDDMVSRMHGMMNIMNSVYDDSGELDIERVSGVTVALCFHIVNILANLEDESRAEYFYNAKHNVIEEIKKEASTLPYWDIKENENE